MLKIGESVSIVLPAAKEALARGNVNFIRDELNMLLQVFGINLDPACADYRKVALAVIKAFVRALEDVGARHRGEAIDSPKLIEPGSKVPGVELQLACRLRRLGQDGSSPYLDANGVLSRD